MKVTNPKPSAIGSSTPAYDTMYDAGNSGASKTIDFAANGKLQKLTLTADCTVTLVEPAGGASCKLILIQDGTGGRVVTFSPTVKSAQGITPVITPTANAKDRCALYWDGTEWWYSAIPNS